MKSETLWTLPLDLPIGHVDSAPRGISNQPFDRLTIGFGCRAEKFGLAVPDDRHELRIPSGAEFIKQTLTTEPEGRGELVICWMRIR